MWSQKFEFGEPAVEPVGDPPAPKPATVSRAEELRKNPYYAFALRVAGHLHQHIDTLWNKGWRRGQLEQNEQDTFQNRMLGGADVEEIVERNPEANTFFVTENPAYPYDELQRIGVFISCGNIVQNLEPSYPEYTFNEEIKENRIILDGVNEIKDNGVAIDIIFEEEVNPLNENERYVVSILDSPQKRAKFAFVFDKKNMIENDINFGEPLIFDLGCQIRLNQWNSYKNAMKLKFIERPRAEAKQVLKGIFNDIYEYFTWANIEEEDPFVKCEFGTSGKKNSSKLMYALDLSKQNLVKKDEKYRVGVVTDFKIQTDDGIRNLTNSEIKWLQEKMRSKGIFLSRRARQRCRTWENSVDKYLSVKSSTIYRQTTPDVTDWMVYAPELATHTEQAYTMITTRWKHLENVRMAYFIMDKKKVTVLFAHLVMLLMRSSAFLTQRRYMLQKTYKMINQQIQKTLYMFKYARFEQRRFVVRR